MNTVSFDFCGARLHATGTGALWWEAERLFCVSDLHLGKAERVARRAGFMLPPYETEDTLARLAAEVAAFRPKLVVALGDSFDDMAAAEAALEFVQERLIGLMAGRRWIWIAGNHDPGPISLGGEHLSEVRVGSLTFRHEAAAEMQAEVSGHFHPKVSLCVGGRHISRPAFLFDGARLILPAYGTYTGGLRATDPALARLIGPGARAILTGPKPVIVPMMPDGARAGVAK